MGLGWWHRCFGEWAVWIQGDGGGFPAWNGPRCGLGGGSGVDLSVYGHRIICVDLWLHMGVIEPQRIAVQFRFLCGSPVQAMGGVDSRAGCRWFIWCGGVCGIGSEHFFGVIRGIFV